MKASFPLSLFLILLVKAIFVAGIIFFAGIQLGPDEAQYWSWSQALDWGYYSKPPGIAWQIWMGTKLFGNSEWGVRSFSIIIAFFQAYAVYLLALRSGLKSVSAFWCGLLMAFSPLGILGSFFAVTDGGFLLCWTGALLTVASSLHHQKEPNPLVVGAWILAGALFKWPIYLFWIYYTLAFIWYFPRQSKSRFLFGIGISLLGLLPSLWWNWSHDWATFRHVFATIHGGSGSHKASGNVIEFLGAQAFLFSPILFVLFLFASLAWFKVRKRISPPLYFCGFVTLTSLGVAAVAACFQKIQGNWAIFAYPSVFILLGWYAFQESRFRQKWVKIGFALSVVMGLMFAFLPTLVSHSSDASMTISYRLNPLKHNLGWSALKQALEMNGYNPSHHFLASDKYQTTSLLSFYNPGQKRAYFLNLHQVRKNQFSYWPSLQDEQKGAEGYFIWVENTPYLERDRDDKLHFYLNALDRYFEEVEWLSFVPLIQENGKIVKGAMIFRCKNCLDVLETDSSLY